MFSSKRSDLSTGGGLSVTGCLSDFSLYVFHPYGGGKKTGGGKREAAAALTPDSATDSERKDSLSVNVEFVKFNLSRSRKINPVPKAEGGTSSSGKRKRFVFPLVMESLFQFHLITIQADPEMGRDGTVETVR